MDAEVKHTNAIKPVLHVSSERLTALCLEYTAAGTLEASESTSPASDTMTLGAGFHGQGVKVTSPATPATGVSRARQASRQRSPGPSRRLQRGGNRWQQLQKHAWHVSSSPPNSNSSGLDTRPWLLCSSALCPATPMSWPATRCCS